MGKFTLTTAALLCLTLLAGCSAPATPPPATAVPTTLPTHTPTAEPTPTPVPTIGDSSLTLVDVQQLAAEVSVASAEQVGDETFIALDANGRFLGFINLTTGALEQTITDEDGNATAVALTNPETNESIIFTVPAVQTLITETITDTAPIEVSYLSFSAGTDGAPDLVQVYDAAGQHLYNVDADGNAWPVAEPAPEGTEIELPNGETVATVTVDPETEELEMVEPDKYQTAIETMSESGNLYSILPETTPDQGQVLATELLFYTEGEAPVLVWGTDPNIPEEYKGKVLTPEEGIARINYVVSETLRIINEESGITVAYDGQLYAEHAGSTGVLHLVPNGDGGLVVQRAGVEPVPYGPAIDFIRVIFIPEEKAEELGIPIQIDGAGVKSGFSISDSAPSRLNVYAIYEKETGQYFYSAPNTLPSSFGGALSSTVIDAKYHVNSLSQRPPHAAGIDDENSVYINYLFRGDPTTPNPDDLSIPFHTNTEPNE